MNSIVTVVNDTFKVKRGDPKSSQPKEKKMMLTMYGARCETKLTGANITKFHIVKLYTFHSIYKAQIIMSYTWN